MSECGAYTANSSSSAFASFRSSGVEAFRKPPVDRSKQFARLLRLALVAPEACDAIFLRFGNLSFWISC